MNDSKSEDVERRLEAYLLKHIPISEALGVKVDVATSRQVVLSAPFLNNINHKNTVFGGSLHAVATLACWSLLHVNLLNLFEENFQIVIVSSEVSYIAPVASDFKAECSIPAPLDWQRFQKILKKKGKARLKLNAKIFQGTKACVNYSGQFVAMKVYTQTI